MIRYSVIIPTRNRASLLDKTLHSLHGLIFPKDQFEVIVVDNGSTDNTRQVAEGHHSSFQNLVYIREVRSGLHQGRHAGMRSARGAILVYADDDIQAFPTWLEGLDECFCNEHVGLAGGRDVPEFESAPPSWIDDLWERVPYGKFLPHYSLLDFGEKIREIEPDFVFGCNFSVRKQLLLDIGGFHPDGMPDDLLQYRGDGETFVGRQIAVEGHKVLYHPKASVHHWVPTSRMTMDYVKKRARMSGVSQSFTDVRQAGSIRSGKLNTLMRSLKQVKNRMTTSPLGHELYRAYWSGYYYHQDKVGKDPELLKWVLQENYLDDEGR